MAYKDKKRMYEYNNALNRQNYDRIGLMVPKGQKATIQASAERDRQSVNAYIQAAIAAYEKARQSAGNDAGSD